VVVWHRSCHEFFLNDAALKKAGIDKAVFDAMPKREVATLSWTKNRAGISG
jgi:hypothetical protein